MRECGEFIAEADLVIPFHCCGVREAVILLLPLLIKDVVQRIRYETVHIIVSSSDHLK